MTIFTIGFTKKSAKTFFELIKMNAIRTLIDIRLNNSSQLAGFSKGSDLKYFLDEICKCNYKHDMIFAPTKEIMDGFKSNKITVNHFEADYLRLMEDRNSMIYFDEHYAKTDSVCLLCSEDTPEHCHRRILADMIINRYSDATIKHL